MIIETPHRCQLPAMLMLFSGLRRGELIALQWIDINLNDKYIYVNKSAELQTGGCNIKDGGKTDSAVRKVAIPNILVDYLKDIIKNTNPDMFDYVCHKLNGKPHTAASFRKMWESYLCDLNLKYGYNNMVSKYNPQKLPMRIDRFTPHYLRHTYATLLYLEGIDIVTAKQYLGHADVQTTINIYTDTQNNSKLTLSEEYKDKLKTSYNLNR